MSRILRRPMFRGGRVDSRGTGIASGLGYAGGGSVNTPKRGLVDEPGGYGGLTFDQRMKVRDFKTAGGPQYGEDQIRERFNKFMDNLYTGDITDMNIAYGMQMPEPVTSKEAEIADTFRTDPETAYTEFRSGLYDDKKYADLQKEEAEIAKLAGLDMTQYGDLEKKEDPGLTAAQLENIELRKLIEGFTNPKELTEDEELAEIEKNKALIQKAYGSGRADDASAMLLNFAGKALKPEATVKSAFGEFFEEEGKRPSERKKYKDAATTAAINAFLTGKKTMAEVEAFKSKSDWDVRNKLAIAKESKNWDVYLIEGAGTGGDPRKMGAISYAVSQMGEELGGVLPELEKGQTYDEILKEGPIYVQDSPDGSFKILVKWDGEQLVPIKQVYKR